MAALARAAALLTQLADPVRATRAVQVKERNLEKLSTLEKLSFKALDTGYPYQFINQKHIFTTKTPGPILERISRDCSSQWREPRMADLMVCSNTCHLSLHLKGRRGEAYRELDDSQEFHESWHTDELTQLCEKIVNESKDSLRSLEIKQVRGCSPYPGPGLSLEHLNSLVPRLSNLTDLELEPDFSAVEIEGFIDNITVNNPQIRHFAIPHLTNSSLQKIADAWPLLEKLHVRKVSALRSDLAIALAKLKNLKSYQFDMNRSSIADFQNACLFVARAHDPTSPPYSLVLEIDFRRWDLSLRNQDVAKLFTAYPGLCGVGVYEEDTRGVCAALVEHPSIHISKLTSHTDTLRPHILQPLLVLQGTHLQVINIESFYYAPFSDYDPNSNFNRIGVLDNGNSSNVDLSMIGNLCPNLKELSVHVYRGTLVAGDEYEITETYFSKLKKWRLAHQYLRDIAQRGLAQLPDLLVSQLFASPDLEEIENSAISISEAVVASVAEQSGEQGALSSLNELRTWHSSTSADGLAELVCRAPRLTTLTLLTDNRSNADFLLKEEVMTAFVQQSRLIADVSSHMLTWSR